MPAGPPFETKVSLMAPCRAAPLSTSPSVSPPGRVEKGLASVQTVVTQLVQSKQTKKHAKNGMEDILRGKHQIQ